MNKEIIKLDNTVDNRYMLAANENTDTYSFIESSIIDFDSEKCCVDYEVIIMRNSDNKYFRGYYTKFGQGQYDYGSMEFQEVTPKLTHVTIYV